MRFLVGLICVCALCASVSCNRSTGPRSGTKPEAAAYVVLAWNDLGMHCINPTYNEAVVLPPYNNLWAQVVKRGNPPQVVTAGLTVEYAIENNTYSYGKRDYGQFWDNAGVLFGAANLPHNIGLKGKGLSGEMTPAGDHFVAEGIPLTPVDDTGRWNPYQVARIVVKDARGATLAETKATVPVSDEIDCGKCHGAQAFENILTVHDRNEHTDLVSSKPVLCARCHASPALGTTGSVYLSAAIHEWHVDKGSACYDCHPGQVTRCTRSLRHMAPDGHCITCHGDLATVASSIRAQRIPWANEPACATCHINVAEVATGSALYRNAQGHGSLYCAACHGSPHAMIPSREASDNYQALQYQGSTGVVKSIGSCGVCHKSSRGQEAQIAEFAKTHGGTRPKRTNACQVCHTVVPTDRTKWPHSYQWKNSN
ncbi:MAG: hypothetical protein V1694_07290 [Candidatus Eisenbacteria bacterium]